jgi:cation:H+ antiporter
VVRSDIVRKELPILLAITFFAVWQLIDLELSHDDAFSLLGIFILLISWSVWQTLKAPKDKLSDQVVDELQNSQTQLKPYLMWLAIGLVLLIVSSRLLIWGAVEVAQYFQVSDVIIGLTIIGIGTSLPELISSIIAVRKNEHELAIGNIVGSNLFNTLAVVGLAGIIQPVQVDATFLYRDALFMLAVTAVLLIFCLGIRGPGKVNRIEGLALVLCFVGYNLYWVSTQF